MLITMKFFILIATLSGIVIISGCKTAQQKLNEQARQGSHSAQAMLSESYLRGYFATVNYTAAKRWAHQGALANRPLALFAMGEIYRHGYGDTVPNQSLAIDYYQRALPQLRKMAAEHNIHASYNLGLMFDSGIVVEKSPEKALYYFRRGIHNDFAPAINQLALYYRNGIVVEKNLSRARQYFLKAALNSYPPAQYNLALLYHKQQKSRPALKWLKTAVAANYPPALTTLAKWQNNGSVKSADKDTSVLLYRQAAVMGEPEAQFELAKIHYADRNLKETLKWLLKAVERSYPPAMLKLAEINARQQPLKALILLKIAENCGAEIPELLVAELDRKTGMSLIIESVWHNIHNGELYLKSNSSMQRIIRGYKAGIGQGSHDLFLNELKKSPENFYLNCDWQLIIKNQLPTAWAGEIFQYISGDYRSYPAFWLAYGTCANQAGSGAIAMYATHRLTIMTEKMPKSKIRQTLLDLAMLIKSNALIILGHEDDAYSILFNYGKINSSPALIAYINHWATATLKNRQKFIAATGLSANQLTDFIKLPAKTNFYDLQNEYSGDGIKTVSPPALTTINQQNIK